MKRRKFLQALGLSAAAPAAVLACPPVYKPWPKPEASPKLDWDLVEISMVEHDPAKDHDATVFYHHVPHNYAFPNKPIYPNYLKTHA